MINDIRSRFIVASDEYTGNIESLAGRAINFGKVTEGGDIIIEDKSITKEDIIKLSLVLRFIAHEFNETIPNSLRPSELVDITNQRVEAVGSKLSELARSGFIKKIGRGQYVIQSYKIDSFLTNLENKSSSEKKSISKSNKKSRRTGSSTKTLTGVGRDIQSLVDEGFFNEPKQISEILKELIRKGHSHHDSRVVDKTITTSFLKNRNILDREENKDGGKSKWKYFIRK